MINFEKSFRFKETLIKMSTINFDSFLIKFMPLIRIVLFKRVHSFFFLSCTFVID